MALMLGKTENEIVFACYNFASAFDKTFGSLRCLELRPAGFSENNPPHMCENLTCRAIIFAYQYILETVKQTYYDGSNIREVYNKEGFALLELWQNQGNKAATTKQNIFTLLAHNSEKRT